ncbi:hypothetical protein FSP39_002607 [Pinctada imbricata]|uniref:MIT domain-containing protein n=1 Tax=Pinctada imbricata TaxID=66713 RepID=A0AA89C8B3_PINIB|nr:hypothetical protein FSP39_002607 [Pinctada imbricata]
MAEAMMPERERTRRPPRPPAPNIRSEVTDMETLHKYHDKAYKLINKGLSLDEEGKTAEAITSYNDGLRYISKGLDMNVENFKCSEDEKNEGKMMQQKMMKTRLQIEYRLQNLERPQSLNGINRGPESMGVTLPSYEEAISSPNSISDEAFQMLGDSIMTVDESQDNSMVANATEMMCIPEGVQIFFISPTGYVSAPSYPSSLRMFKFTDEAQRDAGDTAPPAFMQVDNWYYPLVPGTSPALHASNGAYIFPDTISQEEGSAVGLLLPNDLHPAQRQQFERLLNSFTNLREQHPSPSMESLPSAPPMEEVMDVPHPATRGEKTAPKSRMAGERMEDEEVRDVRFGERRKETAKEEGEDTSTSSKIARGITVASEWISWGVGKGSEKASSLFRAGSEKIKARLTPEDKPANVDPKVQKSIEYARKGTHVAVTVSSFLVTKLGEATKAIAKEVAPHLRKQGEKLLPKSVKQQSMSDNTQSKLDGVIEVAASGVKGFGVVYMSLEAAAKALARNMANETVSVVDHKYGSQAAKLTDNALFAVGNVAMTANNVDNFGVKAIAKRAAKDAGKEVVKDAHKAWKAKNDNETSMKDYDHLHYSKKTG